MICAAEGADLRRLKIKNPVQETSCTGFFRIFVLR